MCFLICSTKCWLSVCEHKCRVEDEERLIVPSPADAILSKTELLTPKGEMGEEEEDNGLSTAGRDNGTSDITTTTTTTSRQRNLSTSSSGNTSTGRA